MHERWWHLYHKTIEAGKKVILTGFEGIENLSVLKAEFGPKLKHFMIAIQAESLSQADNILNIVSDWDVEQGTVTDSLLSPSPRSTAPR
jgi:hydrogenase maturation factor